MTRILIRSIAVADYHGGGSAYEWTVIENNLVIGHGTAPTILEAAMHAGNGTYDGWGYAKEAGRLAITGEKVTVVPPEEIARLVEAGRLPYEAPTVRYCCNKEAPCQEHAAVLAEVFHGARPA
jgi:hypothetical protein